MYDRILVPTDGSDAAAAGAEAAVALARRFDAELSVVHVLNPNEHPPDDADGPEDTTQWGNEAVDEVVEIATDAGLEATGDVLEHDDSIPETILAYAASHDVDCIVMGTTGRTGLGRYVLGSVAEQTVRASSVPVVTVHEDITFDPEFESILVPTDGSDHAFAAADHAVDLATATGAGLDILHVVDIGALPGSADPTSVLDALQEAGERALNDVIDLATEADVPAVEASVMSGSPYRAIVKYAEENDIGLVVMGTHGRTGLDRYFLGSVTERVVRRSDVPVLVVSKPD
ncbi:universal stress protein [Haloferax larsenii]|uniref:Nucleotide-binding universal stress protein, UspA family n=1 Tax=Haloferax larsenii TaxID=302484 RepID=A0A1H7PZS7_HALLR|nr:universal stress protein [Haloferax larsenii]SEL41223.1 Nucleotide-binding universal stress protein, UspA family [Haloferax larsenii]